MKAWIIILVILFSYQFYFFQEIFAQEEQSENHDFSELLKDENKYIFLTNQKGNDFSTNFDDSLELKSSKNNILIKSGTSITLDGNVKHEFSTMLVEGTLRIIDTSDSALKVQKIIIAPSGQLIIGTEQDPINKKNLVEIVFKRIKEGEIGIFVFGRLEIHGHDIGPSFVELQTFVKAGSKRVVVNELVNEWEKGKSVIITSPGIKNCNEKAEISNVDGIFVSLNEPLSCNHRSIGSDKDKTIAPYIALLDRNVKFVSDDKNERGSVNFFHGSSGYIKYAQFDELGPKNVLARYPIHFHHMKDSSRGIEVIGNAITNSENRWITIHDSNGILVKNNVGYKAIGHGYFLEDGTEFENVFENNIGIITYSGDLIESDKGTAIFWITNPMNSYQGNVAVDGKYWGFIISIPNEEVYVPTYDHISNLKSLPSLKFDDNVVYNNRFGAMKIDRHAILDEKIDSSEIIISNLRSTNTILNSKQWGIELLGSDVTISNSTILNSKIGIELFGTRNIVENTKIEVERNIEYDTLVSGIVIAGKNHIINNVEIKGYIDRGKNFATDISLSDNGHDERMLSAKIVNVTLLDPNPIFFGKQGNDDSFLAIYGHDMPFIGFRNLPENFILKKIGTDKIAERGEYNNFEFMAMIKKNAVPFSENFETNLFQDVESEKIEVIKSFKNYAFAWKQNRISDNDFSKELEILVMTNIIKVAGMEANTSGEYDFTVPNWIKNLIGFWSNNAISDKEFMNAIEYILELQMDKRLYSYN